MLAKSTLRAELLATAELYMNICTHTHQVQEGLKSYIIFKSEIKWPSESVHFGAKMMVIENSELLGWRMGRTCAFL